MNFKMIVILLAFTITSCTTANPMPTVPPTLTSTQLPTQANIPSPTTTFTVTTVSLPPGKQIIFDSTGTKDLTGTTYGEGRTAILLANMSIGGAKQWNPFVAAVDPQLFTTITFNYRNINDVTPDMNVILDWLRKEGFERVICIGASLGTRACNHIALQPEMVGMVLVAGAVHHATVAEAAYPKLFIAGALDRWSFDIKNGYEKASEPKELVLFENNDIHGTDLFYSQDGAQFLSLLIDFVSKLGNP